MVSIVEAFEKLPEWRSMPLISTAIGFCIGLFALGFVDVPPPDEARVAEPVPVQSPRARACELVREAANEARDAHDWVGVLRLTEERACWPSERPRLKLRVKALLELKRFSACIEAARDLEGDPEVARWVALCRKRMELTL